MRIGGNQKRLYLLSAVLMVITLVIVTAFGLWGAPDTDEPGAVPAPGAAATPQASLSPAPTTSPEPESAKMRTVVYYQDNYGYLVPVTRTLPAEEGVAKATLSMMVQSAYNDMEAARLGLRTVLPEGTEIDLDVTRDGTARIDLSEQVLKLSSAEAESNMVAAVVQTLTEFPTVKQVEFLVGGRQRNSLTFGTDISGAFERGTINLESAQSAFAPGEADTVRLYFPGETSSLIVPVTRMVYGLPDLDTAVLELAKGPGGQSPLERALPEGCGLISAHVENGVATVNFTREFMNVAEHSDGGRAALRALVLTCTQFDGIQTVRVQVEGEDYDPGESTLATPTFVNDASSLTQEYIRTQTAALIELE